MLVSLDGVTLAQQGTLEEYCEVIRTRGQDAVIDVEVYRPADNGTYEGQFNGDELALVDGDADPVDPVGTFVTVEDDTGTLSVDVPDSWVQVAGAPFTDSAGVTWDALTVSPDLQEFAIDYLIAGVALQSSPALVGTDKDAALTSFTSDARASCTPDEHGRLRRRVLRREIRDLHRLRCHDDELRGGGGRRRRQHALHGRDRADGQRVGQDDGARHHPRHLLRALLTQLTATPLIGGWWKVSPNTRSEAPTRSR